MHRFHVVHRAAQIRDAILVVFVVVDAYQQRLPFTRRSGRVRYAASWN
jgi:hypothetical protein